MINFTLPARLFVIVLAASTCAQAQLFGNPPPREGTTYDVGVAAGMVGGGGLSVRRWTESGHGLQLNFLPFYVEEKYPADGEDYFNKRVSGSSYDAYISLGGLYMKRIAKLGGIQIFPFGGAHYSAAYAGGTYEEETFSGGTVTRSGTKRTGVLAVGGGMGASVAFWRLMEYSMMLGMRGAYDLKSETRALTPSIDIALHFRI
jgi:hypothetical protein